MNLLVELAVLRAMPGCHDNVWRTDYTREPKLLSSVLTAPRLRSEKLDLRLTPEAKRTLQQAAAVAQRSVTDFVVESAMVRAAETLADRRSFHLEASAWEAFVAALDGPTQPRPRLTRLLQEPSVFEVGR